MSGAPLIACTRCAISKARCDRKVPCSQCVARNYVCQPRFTSRRPRAPRRAGARSHSSISSSAEPADPSSASLANMEEFPEFSMSDNQSGGNEVFDFGATAFPQVMDGIGYEDFMGLSYPITPNPVETTDGNLSHNPFSSWQLSTPPPTTSTGTVLSTPTGPAVPAARTDQHVQRPSPEHQNAPAQHQRPEEALTPRDETTDHVLGDMVELLAQPDAWQGLSTGKGNASQVLSHDARDRIVAAVQLLLHRALQTRSSSSAASNQGLFGRIVALPPSHVLVHFIELYAARIDTIQPYLGLAGSPTISIKDILQVDTVDVGILLVILLITQGAMLTDHRQSLILADGLTEVCRLALNDVLESKSISQPMVGGSALQLLTLCAWSGKQAFASFAMSKRGQYLSMLKYTGLLQPEPNLHSRIFDDVNPWEKWKEQEQRNRLAYSWVYVDLEISLLHDLPPVLSINDLHVPLPQDTNLWHAQSYSAWIEHYGTSGSRLDEETQSLNSLFRSFLQGRLASRGDVSFHHLRLLLHPLQSMVLEQQQLLRIFDSDEPSNRHRVLSKIKVLGRLQETQDLLQQLTTLLGRTADANKEQDSKQARSHLSMGCVSMIMLHLVSLNVFTSIPEVERCAKEDPPASEAERAEMWRWARYPEGESYILFHAGQIFRLIDSLHIDARPAWWPVAVYRAGLACWSLRRPGAARTAPSNQLHGVAIDTLLPTEEDRFLNSSAGTAVVTLSDGRRLSVLEGNNSLHYCSGLLEKHATRLVQSMLEKVRYFSDKWS